MVHASLFGVGAPEVLVIGVVALLVFGPKGLAEVGSLMFTSYFSYKQKTRTNCCFWLVIFADFLDCLFTLCIYKYMYEYGGPICNN